MKIEVVCDLSSLEEAMDKIITGKYVTKYKWCISCEEIPEVKEETAHDDF